MSTDSWKVASYVRGGTVEQTFWFNLSQKYSVEFNGQANMKYLFTNLLIKKKSLKITIDDIIGTFLNIPL